MELYGIINVKVYVKVFSLIIKTVVNNNFFDNWSLRRATLGRSYNCGEVVKNVWQLYNNFIP